VGTETKIVREQVTLGQTDMNPTQTPIDRRKVLRRILAQAGTKQRRSAKHFDAPTARVGEDPCPALFPKEGESGLHKLRRRTEEDRPMAAVWYGPESRSRNLAIHLNRHLDRIKEVAVSMDDQR
jgi:hypothetical protein